MKRFLWIWFGEFISSIGSGMTSFALQIYVYQQTGSVSLVSLTTLLAFLPTILLSPLGGVLADRYDRRLLMLTGDSFSGLGVLLMLWSVQTKQQSMLPIFIGITFSAVFASLLEPAYRATVTDLLTQDEYTKASGMVQVAGNAKYLISPAIAGILLAAFDIRLVFCIDIATFFVTLATVNAVRKTIQKPARENQDKIGQSLRQGMDVLLENKGVMTLVFIMTGVCFFIGFVQTLLGPMLLAVTDAKTVEVTESLCAVGMLAGSLWIGFVGIRQGQAKVLTTAGMLCGIFIALAGVNKSLLFTAGSIFLFFLCLPFMNTCADVLIRVNIPNELQGRAWGLISLITQFGMVVAYASCGLLSDHVFEPAMAENGLLSGSIGRLIGTGAGRGIGLLLILSGAGLCAAMLLVRARGTLKSAEIKKETEETTCFKNSL